MSALLTEIHWLRRSIVALISASSLVISSTALAELMPTQLRVEHRKDPQAIDRPQPMLGWQIKSQDRGTLQAAYQILVASSRARLDQDQGDLWDSGKVQSGQTVNVCYEGRPLASHMQCHWKVRVWDQREQPSDWSHSSRWSMGIVAPDKWQAEWIGYDTERAVESTEAALDGAEWIMDKGDDPTNSPQGLRLFVRSFALPPGTQIEQAEVLAASDNKFWLAINGKMLIHGESGWQTIKPVPVADVLVPGNNEIRVQVENDSPGPTGLILKLTLTHESGTVTTILSDEDWYCVREPGQHWPTRAIADGEHCSVQIVGSYGCEPWGIAKLQELQLPPVSRFRREFVPAKPVESATLYLTALGLADAYLNGKRVNEDYFAPGWTDYAKRVYYRGYDVTDRLTSGTNVLGGELADGWYCGYIGWGQNRNHYGTAPRMAMQLVIRFRDGTTQLVQTGPDWKAQAGPTRHADFLMGESCDARLEDPAWSSPGYDASKWHGVVVGAEHTPRVEAHPGPPVVAIEEFEPKTVAESKPGTYVLDLGQNFAGVVRLQVSEPAGRTIRLRFAERLNPDGTLYTTNLRGARATDIYTCRGEEIERWSPRFTFHGFQYVEVTGLSKRPEPGTITGVALSTDTPRTGQFKCSDEMLNQLVSNIYWTQRANFIDVPTDCPQRDERLGWTGDAQVYVATAALNADVQAFFDKWLIDLADAQRSDGQFPMVAPLKVAGDDGGPAWADAGVICPWTLYEVYQDRRLLERQYESMKRFVEFCRARSVNGVLPPKEFHCFGDWLSINAETPKEVIYTAYYANSARLLARTADVLGRQEDAEEYALLFGDIKRAFNEAHVDDNGRVAGDTQCGYVLALANNLLDDETKQRAASHLVNRIEDCDFHLSTGFVGTKDLMLVLSQIGRNDVAYRLLQNKSFPSWGFSIQHGATSIWERWDGWTPENGFQDPGMNSFAHYSFGAVYQWMVENVGGIRRESPGYERITIAPQPGGDLAWADVAYDSVRGRIACRWRKADDGLNVKVEVPANSTARVILPVNGKAEISESGRPVAEAEGVIAVGKRESRPMIEIGSGKYSFLVKRSE